MALTYSDAKSLALLLLPEVQDIFWYSGINGGKPRTLMTVERIDKVEGEIDCSQVHAPHHYLGFTFHDWWQCQKNGAITEVAVNDQIL